MILEAPEGRRIQALRAHSGYASACVTLIDRAGRELLMGPDAAGHTGVLLIAAGTLASGLADALDLPAIHRAVEAELMRQIAHQRAVPALADAITRAHAEADAHA